MPTSPLKKVEALIARTSSSSEEEARTSAFLACQLIRKHGFKVIDPKKTKPAKKTTKKRSPTKTTGFGWLDDLLDDFVSHAEDVVRVDPFAPNRNRVFITTAKFPGKCTGCGVRFRVGEKIAFYPNRTPKEVYHDRCSSKATSS